MVDRTDREDEDRSGEADLDPDTAWVLQADGGPDQEPDPDEDEWRFSLEDLSDEADGDGAGVAGSFGPSEEIESESIELENALFFVVGVVIATAGLWLMLTP